MLGCLYVCMYINSVCTHHQKHACHMHAVHLSPPHEDMIVTVQTYIYEGAVKPDKSLHTHSMSHVRAYMHL